MITFISVSFFLGASDITNATFGDASIQSKASASHTIDHEGNSNGHNVMFFPPIG